MLTLKIDIDFNDFNEMYDWIDSELKDKTIRGFTSGYGWEISGSDIEEKKQDSIPGSYPLQFGGK